MNDTIMHAILAYVISTVIEAGSQNVGARERQPLWLALVPAVPPMILAACIAEMWSLSFPRTWVVLAFSWRAIIVTMFIASRRR